MGLSPGIDQVRRELTERCWSEQDLVEHVQSWAYRNGEGTLGITRSYVSEWLNGRRGVSGPYARRISGVLGIPVELFVDGRTVRGREERDVQRRDFLRLAAGATAAAALGGEQAAGLDDHLGFAGKTARAWPEAQLGRSFPDHGVDYQLVLPGGRSFDGVTIPVQVHEATGTTSGRVVLDASADPGRFRQFVRSPRRGLLVGATADEHGDTRYYASDSRQIRHNLGAAVTDTVASIPQSFELDDLTFGMLWAAASLDDSLLADDVALADGERDLRAYAQLASSAVSREAASDLTTVSQMWLGSSFCAQHIIRSLDGVTDQPVFWTREQRGEEASTWLLFHHKYEYLRATSSRLSTPTAPLTRAFCVPEAAVRDSRPYERVLLLLAVALMESLDIRVRLCVEPEYGNVDGFVLPPDDAAIIATWVRSDGIWHVDRTARRPVVTELGEAAGHAQAHSVIEAPTAARRLRKLTDYLEIDWAWLHRRCQQLGRTGTAAIVRPRNRLLSTEGLDAACRFIGQLPGPAHTDAVA